MTSDEQEIIEQIVEMAGELEWMVAVAEPDEGEEVPGIIIGTEEYIHALLSGGDDGDDDGGDTPGRSNNPWATRAAKLTRC